MRNQNISRMCIYRSIFFQVLQLNDQMQEKTIEYNRKKNEMFLKKRFHQPSNQAKKNIITANKWRMFLSSIITIVSLRRK